MAACAFLDTSVPTRHQIFHFWLTERHRRTTSSLAGIDLPKNDRDGKPIIFDSYDMTPVLLGTGKSKRDSWFYFTENELTPGAARVGRFKAEFNIRGDDGQATGGLAVDSNLGWKGPEKYVATVPQIYDLWADPQERYDIFMNNFTEHTWTLVTINASVKELMKTYVQYPPRKLQSEGYSGPITLTQYQRFAYIREALQKDGFNIPLPTGTEPLSLPEEACREGHLLNLLSRSQAS